MSAPSPAALEASSGTFRLLLVEDNPDEAELCRRALLGAGFRGSILSASDGVEALRLVGDLAPEWPDVILLDLKLPRLDGLDVLRQLKGHPDQRLIPVVVMSSSEEQRDRESSYRLGANSYVVKPVDPEEFARVVGQVAHYWSSINRRPR